MLHHHFEKWIANEDGIPILNPEYRFLFSHGGRGGGKSEFVAEALLLIGSCKKMKILCAREFMNSIDDSVLSVLESKADQFFPGFYTKRNNKLYGINGTTISFKGLSRNIGSIKSLDGYDICWIEEGQYISAVAWELLEPTIRKDGSQFIITMNREDIESVLDKQFIQDTPPPRTLVTKVNLDDNPFDTPILDEQSEALKIRDLEAWNYIFGGDPNTLSKAEILGGKCIVEDFDTPEGINFYHGGDWSNGGSHPHAFTRSFILDNHLYIDWEFCTNADLNEDFYAALDTCPTLNREKYQGQNAWRVYCDNANSGNTRRLGSHGFRARDAKKNFGGLKGSVQAGIDYLRGFDAIHIHKTNCPTTAKHAKGWKWTVDKRSGDILPIRIDINDDCIAATRYGHWKNIKKGKS